MTIATEGLRIGTALQLVEQPDVWGLLVGVCRPGGVLSYIVDRRDGYKGRRGKGDGYLARKAEEWERRPETAI